jgi:hypothetical protein
MKIGGFSAHHLSSFDSLRSLLMNKNVEEVGLQTKSASQLPLRGDRRLASQRKFIPAATR